MNEISYIVLSYSVLCFNFGIQSFINLEKLIDKFLNEYKMDIIRNLEVKRIKLKKGENYLVCILFIDLNFY